MIDLRAVWGQSTDAYFLVIDNSYSMAEKGRSGRPRFVEMQEHAREILSQIPLGSEVQVTAFSDEILAARRLPFTTEEERAAAIDLVTRMCDSPKGKTRLYDTLGSIFSNAETIFHSDREREVRVLVFTDGLDTTSTAWTKSSLLTRFTEVVTEHPNVWLFFTSIGKSDSKSANVIEHPHALQHKFLHPILLKTNPRKITLDDPAFSLEQEFEIEFDCPSAEMWDQLQQRPVKLRFIDDGGELTASVDSAEMRPGPIRVPIRFHKLPSLMASQSRTGRIQLEYPEVPGFEVRAANSIPIEFKMRNQPFISIEDKVKPTTNRPVLFHLHNANDAVSIKWLVDDIESTSLSTEAADGYIQARAIFDSVGKHSIAAQIAWANNQTISVESSFTVAPRPVTAHARFSYTSPIWISWLLGSRVQLVDESTGDILTSRWLVNGQPIDIPSNGLWLLRNRPTSVELVVEGSAHTNNSPNVDKYEFVVPAAPLAQFRPYFFAGFLLILFAILWPWFFAKYPYGCRFQYCTETYPRPGKHFGETDLSRFWRARRQDSLVPLSALFSNSPYWAQANGARECLRIQPRATGSDLGVKVRYSGDSSPYVLISPLFRDEHPGVCFRITDNRCDQEEFRELYFRLLPGNITWSIVRCLGFILIAALGLNAAFLILWG